MKVRKVIFSLAAFLILMVGTYFYDLRFEASAPASASGFEKSASKIHNEGKHNLVPIFLFHNLDGDGRYSISREEFRAYLDIIKESGVRVISMKTLFEHIEENRLLSEPSVVITIDDDFENIARVAAPLLREYRFPATIFVYVQGINSHPRGGMSWDDLKRLHREGFDIQNHSWTHGKFYRPWGGESWSDYEKRVSLEIIQSKEVLETKIPGSKIYAFSFPMGYYNEYLEERLRSAGYSMMLTVKADPVDVKGDFTGIAGRYTIESGDLKKFKKRFIRQLEMAKNEYGSIDRSVSIVDRSERVSSEAF